MKKFISKLKNGKGDPEVDLPQEGIDPLDHPQVPAGEDTADVSSEGGSDRLSFTDLIKSKFDQLKSGNLKNADVAADLALDDFEGGGDLDEITEDPTKIAIYDGIHTVTINEKRMIIGLQWEILRAGVTPKIAAEKVNLASKGRANIDLFVNLKTENQAGLVQGSKVIKPGDKAGATCFPARRLGRFWLAAFELPGEKERWWVVAMRDGQIYEDSIYSDLSSARAVFMENHAAPDWQRVIAPEDWNIEGVESYSLVSVMHPGSGQGLKPINPIKTYLPYIIAGVVSVGSIVAGYHFYTDYQLKKKIEAREAAAARKKRIVVTPMDYPWFDTPSLAQFFDKCIPEMEGMVKYVPGWEQRLISCSMDGTEASVTTSWKNNTGYVHWMMAAFPPDENQPLINVAGDQASRSSNIDFGVETQVLDKGWPEEKVDAVLRRRFQTLGLDNVSMAPVIKRITPEQRISLQRPVFNRHDFKLQTSAALYEYASLFADVPAVVPDQLVYDLDAGIWNLSFKVYHQAILPQ